MLVCTFAERIRFEQCGPGAFGLALNRNSLPRIGVDNNRCLLRFNRAVKSVAIQGVTVELASQLERKPSVLIITGDERGRDALAEQLLRLGYPAEPTEPLDAVLRLRTHDFDIALVDG
jgi:hypothetical protein